MKNIGDVLRKVDAGRFIELAQAASRLDAVNERLFALDQRRAMRSQAAAERDQKTVEKLERPEYQRPENADRKTRQQSYAERGAGWPGQQAAATLRAGAKEMIVCAWCGTGHLYPVHRAQNYENTHCFMCRQPFGSVPTAEDIARRDYVTNRPGNTSRAF